MHAPRVVNPNDSASLRRLGRRSAVALAGHPLARSDNASVSHRRFELHLLKSGRGQVSTQFTQGIALALGRMHQQRGIFRHGHRPGLLFIQMGVMDD